MVAYTSIVLTLEQFKIAVADLGGRYSAPKVSKASVDLANILDDSSRRKRKERFSTPTKKPQAKSTPAKSTPRRNKRGGDDVETSAVETETTDVEQSGKKRRRAATRARKVSSSTEEDSTLVATPKSSQKRVRRPSKKEKAANNLFKGMNFLITRGTKPPAADDDKLWNETEDDDEEEEEDEDEDTIRADDEPKMSKSLLTKLVTEHGGRILSSFPCGKYEPTPQQVVVLSDRHCQTMTYLLGVAYKFPLVHFKWAQESVAAG